jgi:TP901 family phage tail tape measure protein
MAKQFNLTAQLNIAGPNNLKPVISKIKTELNNIKLNLKLDVPTGAAKNVSTITKKLNELSAASIRANGNVATLARTLQDLGSGFSSFASSTTNSINSIKSTESSLKTVNKTTKESVGLIEDFGEKAGLALKRFAAFSTITAAVYGFTNALSAAYKEFLDFNTEIVRLSQVTGSSQSDLKGVTDEITRLSITLGVTSKDLIAVTSTLAQAGLSASDTKTALEALAKSSLAPSFQNIADTTEGAIAILRQFGLGAKDLEKALGSINAVAAAFAVESGDLITAIQRTGGVFAASSKGVSEGTDSLNEFIAVFTSIRATTRESAETIATGLRTIFTRVQRSATIDLLKQYGVELRDLEGKFVGPYEAVRRLSEGLNKLDPRGAGFARVAEELGGFRQIGKVIPLIQQFTVAEEALGVAQRGQSSLSKDAITAQQALSVQFTKTRESFIALVRDIGNSTSFQSFVSTILSLTNAFIGLVGALKPLLPLLVTLGTIKFAAALPKYVGLGNDAGLLKGIGLNRKSSGGTIGFARGGLVPGSGNRDTVPAMLMPGEFVMRKSAVQAIGTDELHNMNGYKLGGKAEATGRQLSNTYPSLKSIVDPKKLYTATVKPEPISSSKVINDMINRKNKNPNMPNWLNFEYAVSKITNTPTAGSNKFLDFPSIPGEAKFLKPDETYDNERGIGKGNNNRTMLAKLVGSGLYKAYKTISAFYPSDISVFQKKLQAKASGGGISGHDTVPAMLTPGEFVINKQSAQKIGYSNLYKMNQTKGFNKGGSVGGIQYFARGGIPMGTNINALEDLLSGNKPQPQPKSSLSEGMDVIALQLGAEILRGQIDSLVKSFDVLENVGVKGFLTSLQQASSASISASIGLKIVGADRATQIKGATIAGAGGLISGALSGAGQTSLDKSLKLTASAFGEFDKSLQDVKDATDEASKAFAQEELNKSFTKLNDTVNSTIGSIQISESFIALGKVIDDTTQAGIAGFQAQLALTSALSTLKTTVDAASVAQAAGTGAGAVGKFLPLLGGIVSIGSKLIPWIGLATTGFTILTSTISYFSNSAKKSAEELVKLSKATQEAALNAPENQLTNAKYVQGLLPIVREARGRGLDTATLAAGIGVPQELDRSSLDPANLNLNFNPLNLALNKKISEQINKTFDAYERVGLQGQELDLNDLFNQPSTKQRVSEAVKTATTQYIEETFARIQSERPEFLVERQQQIGAAGVFGGYSDPQKRTAVELFRNTKDAGKLIADLNRLDTENVRNSVISLMNVLDSLNKSFDRLTDEASLSLKALDDSINIALGKSNIDSITRPFERNILTLSNLSKASSTEIESALSSSSNLLTLPRAGQQREDLAFIGRLEENVKQLAIIEKEFPAILQTIAEESTINESEITRRLEPLFRGLSNTDTQAVARELTDAINNAKTEGGQQPLTTKDLAKLSQSTGRIFEGLNVSAETLVKANEAVIKTQHKYNESLNKLIEIDLQKVEVQNQIIEAQNNILLQKIKFSGGSPTLNQLNEPFNQNIRELTGGLSTPQAIVEAIKARTAQRQKYENENILLTQEQFAATDTKKLQIALEILTTSTTKASNAMAKAAEREEALNSKRNLFESIVTGQMSDPNTIGKFEEFTSSLQALKSGAATEEQLINILQNLSVLTQAQQNAVRKDLYTQAGVRFPEVAGTLNPLGDFTKDPTYKGYLSAAEKAIQETIDALKQKGDLLDSALFQLTQQLPDVRERFLSGLDTELQAIVKGMEEVRARVVAPKPITTQSVTTQSTTPSSLSVQQFDRKFNELRRLENTPIFIPMAAGGSPYQLARERARLAGGNFRLSDTVAKRKQELGATGQLGTIEGQKELLGLLMQDIRERKNLPYNDINRLGSFEIQDYIKKIQEEINKLNREFENRQKQQLQQPQQPVPQPQSVDTSQYIRDLKQAFAEETSAMAATISTLQDQLAPFIQGVAEFKNGITDFSKSLASVPTSIERRDTVEVNMNPIQVTGDETRFDAMAAAIENGFKDNKLLLSDIQRNGRVYS